MPHDPSKMIFGNAAGTVKNQERAEEFLRYDINRETIGTTTFDEHRGNLGMTHYYDPATGGYYNANGFRNRGMKAVLEWLPAHYRRCKDKGIELVKSIADPNPKRLGIMAESFKPHCDRLELDLGFSNLWIAGVQSPTPSKHPDLFAAHLDAVRSAIGPRQAVSVKIAPVEDEMLAVLMEIVWKSGVINEVVAANSHGGHRPKREDGTDAFWWQEDESAEMKHTGALSGLPILEANLHVAAQARRLLPNDHGVVGSGGISTGAHLLKYLDREADGALVGAQIIVEGPLALNRIKREAQELSEQ